MTTNKTEILYPKLSYAIVGILFSVHNELGPFAREKQYGDMIEIQFKDAGISYKRELSIGNTGNILDFVVNNEIIVELKAARIITPEHYRQIQNYLQQTRLKLGILVNFRRKFLSPKRIICINS